MKKHLSFSIAAIGLSAMVAHAQEVKLKGDVRVREEYIDEEGKDSRNRVRLRARVAVDAVVKPPVMLVHGDEDPVVPFQDMSLAGDALVKAGFETYAHVMKGTGHGIAPDGLGVALQFLKSRLPA